MWTARSNFSHIIVTEQEGNHQLVTTGVYSVSRHPSYLGWFCWSIGTQLLLCNPFCVVAYAVAAISFFRERVPYEERMLINIFQEEYTGRHPTRDSLLLLSRCLYLRFLDYQSKVPIRIPFVYGYTATPYERKLWTWTKAT